ncbi:MAG: copper-binding protein [Rhizobacter sp.]|jgi:Cu/Ag efflux protein CusF
MKRTHFLAAAALLSAFGAHAQATHDHTHDHPAAQAAPAGATPTDGEVRKIDREQGKVTLKHGPIAHLEMPGMTMVFKVTDPRMLDNLKDGDKVRFSADRVNGSLAVTAIEPVR